MPHTPGPWSAPSASIYAGPIAGPITDRFATGPMIASLGGRLIVKSMRQYGRNVSAEIVANARLMAAAPELLAALKMALSHLEVVDPDRYAGNGYANIRAAIAKAEGGST